MIKMFWWSANDSSNIYLARKKWKDICKTKELGGVGFRSFKEMNNSMLAKLGQYVASNSDKFQVHKLKRKYCKQMGFLQIRAKQ